MEIKLRTRKGGRDDRQIRNKGIARAVESVGSQSEFARRLTNELGRKVHQGQVWRYIYTTLKFDGNLLRAMVKATEGKFTIEQLLD